MQMLTENRNIAKRVSRFFDEQARDYNGQYSNNDNVRSFIFSERKRIVLEMLGSNFGNILDSGCGPGVYSGELSLRCGKLYGVDVSSKMIEIAKARNLSNAEFSVGRVEALQFRDGVFDAVVCVGVLEYLDNIEEGIREIARITKAGGAVIFTTQSAASILNKLDYLIRLALRLLYGIIKIDFSKSFMNYDFWPRMLSNKEIAPLLQKYGFRIEKERFHIFRISLLNRIAPELSLFLAKRLNFISNRFLAINYIVRARRIGLDT